MYPTHRKHNDQKSSGTGIEIIFKYQTPLSSERAKAELKHEMLVCTRTRRVYLNTDLA